MKKFYTIALALIGSVALAQSPILTAIVDGPCTGGTPKLLEIYASGTVDFTQFTLQNQTNANTDWGVGTGGAQDLSAFGTRTNEFVYVVMTNGDLSIATTEFSNVTESNSIESGTMNLNGDDRVRIINTATQVVIDQFGVEGVDGTGSTWEWLDSYAMRVSETGPDGAFTESNWTFGGVDALDNVGICKEAAALSTVVALGSYTPANASVKDNNIAGLSVYPNPLSGNTLYVTSNNSIEKSVAIFDVLGKQVVNTTTSNGAVNVNLNAGVYIVKVTEEGKTATRKLVVR
jgi:hypothetical protein